MVLIDPKTKLWKYLSETQRDLIREGNYLMEIIMKDHAHKFKDYAFLVFPYAKAYEGFLKQLFLDVGFISHLDYISDHFRLGKFLSPHLIDRLGDRSIYAKIRIHATHDLADKIWHAWKLGRNQIFHYYPHNIKRITLPEAQIVNQELVETMQESYKTLGIRTSDYDLR